ncbi:M23 family metallopeptidase [uncultured Jatrophihabitans sp.]|uniref:M23 family metallopeptidase n=1 Tax=uncultured Jatrophihabitans sp. TaxID=1610747 RepID=UPI0035CA01B0
MPLAIAQRTRAVLLLVLIALLCLTGAATAAAAGATAVGDGASAAHPYSDPVWWPVSVPASMGCYRGNPGCGGDHATYIWDIVGQNGVDNQAIYPMGAGIVHIGATGTGCGGVQNRGDYVYVDHGNGVLTYYGHLGRILVHNGEYVSPRTALAYMGNSGYAKCHTWPLLRYVMVALKHGGRSGQYVELRSTYACPADGGSRTTWPQYLPSGAAAHWNAVTNQTPIPATSTSRSCITAPATTAAQPTGVGLARRGASTMYAHWSRAWSGYGVGTTVVALQEYHPSIRRWLPQASAWLSGSATSVSFARLTHRRQYRVYVMFHNAAGYSALSAGRYAGIGK